MRSGARSLGAIVAALIAGGMLATVARSDSCRITIRWNDAVYRGVEARFAVLEPGDGLGEARIPDCTAGGRCAPPEDAVAAFEVPNIPPAAAVLAPDYHGLFAAAGTFPQLADPVPLHEAVYGHPSRPSFRADCGAVFAIEGTVNLVDPRRIDVHGSEVELSTEDEGAWLEVDSGMRIEGFDRQGIATLEPGDEIAARAQICEGELAGPLAVSIQPAG